MEFVDKITNPQKFLNTDLEVTSGLRIYGKIGNLDLYSSTCTLSYNNVELPIDTTLIGPFPYKKGEIYYAYGKITKKDTKTLVLKATILKNVTQLDLRLMDAVLEARSAYFTQ